MRRGVRQEVGEGAKRLDVALEVGQGQIVSLLGGNASGKSTTMKIILGLLTPRSGTVTFDGARIDGLPTHRVIRAGIGSVPEARRIFPLMSVRENLLMGAEAAGRTDTPALLEEVFALFPRLSERMSQRGGTLSGGEQQMLAIARALMSRPRLLLLDEPSLGLAPLVARQIFGEFHVESLVNGGEDLLFDQLLDNKIGFDAELF